VSLNDTSIVRVESVESLLTLGFLRCNAAVRSRDAVERQDGLLEVLARLGWTVPTRGIVCVAWAGR